MFVMMNAARLGVAVQGLSLSEVAYQNAAAYAKERLQGRSLTGPKAPDKPADPLLVHPDVRRMLLEIRAFNEAARALMLWVALSEDEALSSPDANARKLADDRVGLLTPVIKGVFTDQGFANAVKAQQVLGGHGYIAEWGMEQFVRDARITMIYEGANGVQALDLVGRKLPKDGGRAITAFFGDVSAFLAANKDDAALAPYLAPAKAALGQLQQATMWLMQNGMKNPDNAGAASNDYMHLFGLTALAFMWARIAKAALARQAATSDAERRRRILTAQPKLARRASLAARVMLPAGGIGCLAQRRAARRSWLCRGADSPLGQRRTWLRGLRHAADLTQSPATASR